MNIFFTFRPTTTLTLVAFIALISMILYGIELKEIKKRDEGLDDIGNMLYAMITSTISSL